MTNSIRFPTQGELVHFIFDSMGILPKRGDKSDHTQKEIERIHKKIERLAKEDGKYLKNFWDCQDLLKEKLITIFQDEYWVTSIGQSLSDLFQCYLDTIHREGTFRDQQTNIRYLTELVWMPRLVISIFKYKWYFHQHFKTQPFPEPKFWFLGTEQKMPLALVIDWIYQVTGHTTTSFHTSSDDEVMQRDLENVRHWRQAKHLPTWYDLEQTFQRAMQHRNISLIQQQHFQRYLFLARWASAILEDIQNVYGTDFTEELKLQFEFQFVRLEHAFLLCYHDGPSKLQHVLQQKIQGFNLNLEKNQEIYDQIAVESFSKYLLEPCLQDMAVLAQQSRKQFVELVRNLLSFEPLDQYCICTIAHKLTGLQYYQALENEHPALENMLQGYDMISGKQPYTNKWLQEHQQSQAQLMFPWLESWVLG